ncbi:MAG: glycolate oxidase subunit GlcE [Rhodocyclaceae bacterium]|nr:glycolate oxidase subunit GlcE [Rhodocyclaceae bacterium]
MSDLTQDFIGEIRAAAAAGASLAIEGAGSKRWYGNPVVAQRALATAAHTGIVDYDPAELVLTARSGTTLADIESTLAERGQMLAFEPPRYARESTLGGAIATALSGPSRPFVGGVRDFVLGMHVIDGKGDVLKFGGQVMKNVAGYDVSRLMTGSIGILGLISQVSLKVLPLPVATATLRFELSEAEAIQRVNEWSGKPLPLTASVWENGILHIRLSGARAAVDSAIQHMRGVLLNVSGADALWNGLRDQTHAFFCDAAEMNVGQTLWRLSLPAIAPAITADQIPGADRQLIEWGGGQRWLWSTANGDAIRHAARQMGGHAVRFNNQHGDGETFAQPSAALMAIHRRLKQTFDPQGIFNPGRLYQGL